MCAAIGPELAERKVCDFCALCPTEYRIIKGVRPYLPISASALYSHLAMHSGPILDLTFHALADGTRRSMIHALARGETLSASDLGRHFRSAQPTISKHLKVLEQAGIVERKVEGRVHLFRLRRRTLEQAGRWIARHKAFWEGAVDQLDQLLAEGAKK